MLTELQIANIREHLEKAQNPIFYFDNDADGLCSFLLLRRFINRGKGVAVKSFPDLNVKYAKKAQELNADYVFVLDKPIISKEFAEEINKMGLPLVWIDHHDIPYEEIKLENFYVFNPTKNKGKDKSEEPVTFLSYNIANRKEDMWIAIMGCIADHFLPDFTQEFSSNYPDFWAKDIKAPFDAYYKTEIGRIARSLGFGLKDSISHVVQLQNFLLGCKSPSDVFSESTLNHSFRKHYEDIRKKYYNLIEKAKTKVSDKLIFFDYAGDLSMSGDLANELSYLYPNKYIAVAYKKAAISNISLRGKNIKKILDKIKKNFEDSTGGGHDDAVGARIKTSDLERFKKELEEEIT